MPPAVRPRQDGRSVNGRKEIKPVEIDGRDEICSVVFLVDGKHVVSGDDEGKIRRWRVDNGEEVEMLMDGGSAVLDISVSRDGRWVVSGTQDGKVAVWDAKNHEQVTEYKAHQSAVCVVDVSPDGTRILTGSHDSSACVWSLSSGQQLLGPLKHGSWVVAAKFSPDGDLIATAWHDSVRIYHSQNGRLLVDFPVVGVYAFSNRPIAWASNSTHLFALSRDGNINCLDACTKATHSQWPIHSSNNPACLALASNGTFIAASANSSVSFWDTTTHKQIGSVIDCTDVVVSMTISPNHDLAIGGGRIITLRSLCDSFPSPYRDNIFREREIRLRAERADLEDTIKSLRAQDERSNERIADLKEVVQELRIRLVTSQQEKANLNEIIENSNSNSTHLEKTIRELRTELSDFQQRANDLLRAHEQKHQCETLYAAGHTNDAAQTLLEITNTVNSEVRANRLIMDWLAEFTTRCVSTLETMGDRQSNAEKHDEALASYTTALSLTPSNPNTLLLKWAGQVLIRGSAKEALCTAYKFKLPRFAVYRVICDTLEADDRVMEAIECFRQMQSELVKVKGTIVQDERAQWEFDFRRRCVEKLVKLGDTAMESNDHALAIQQYSDALMLDPTNPSDILLKRSKVQALNGLWEEALVDADKVIELDPSLPWGHERKHAALLGAHRYDQAVDAYSDMLLKLEQSPDPATQELRSHFVTPTQTKAAIRSSVKRNQRDAPLVLINTESGRLRNTHERSEEFEADPSFKELVSSMTRLDNPRITQTVKEYFRYATFSHTWEGAEPLFHHVLRDPVHNLPTTPTNFKLVMFCKTAREAGLRWAWSDTCCIDKTDSSVLQESLTSMFKWYHKSSLTIVHLKGVWSNSQLRALIRCIWNTRAWTLQEFFASRIIRFYTEDWKPYLPQEDTRNHKDSSEMMAEMAAATGVDAQILLSLRPGSENVRQKLRLAATRVATKQEDMAYSLFGIFDVSISATYGEGQERALGRLLQEVLTRSGDLTVLAWTGSVSEFNSCLPADISVYREPASPHVPSPIEDVEMDMVVTELRSSLGDLNSAITLYDLVIRLPPPRLASRRLSLSCVMFPLGELLASGGDGEYVYRTMSAALGKVEIKTTEDLPILDNLVLVHPWLRCLLDPVPPFEDLDVNIPFDVVDGDHSSDPLPTDMHSPSSSHTMSPSRQSSLPRLDKLTRALRFFARLRQPFGALLLVPLSHSEYKRVASDNPIVVQLRKDVLPRHLVRMTRSLDIL